MLLRGVGDELTPVSTGVCGTILRALGTVAIVTEEGRFQLVLELTAAAIPSGQLYGALEVSFDLLRS